MIKFFRKIRKSLLIENKLTKYLIYAIGEVFLVVIGILMALQLNNLNDNKKNKGFEKDYLVRIQSDINQDLSELERHFKNDTLVLDAYTFLGSYYASDSITKDPIGLVTTIGKAGKISWFEGKNIVFDDMKSSGRTALITSDSLRNKIQNYYRLFDEVIKQETLNNSFITNLNSDLEAFYKMGALTEFVMPERWKDSSDEALFYEFYGSLMKINEDQKKIISDNYRFKKYHLLQNHKVRLLLHKEGLSINEAIDAYLEDGK